MLLKFIAPVKDASVISLMVRTFAPVSPTDCNSINESAPTLVAVIDPPHLVSSRLVMVRAALVLTCWAITERIKDW